MYLIFELNSEKLGNEISIFDLFNNINNINISNINEELKNIGDNSCTNKKIEFFIYPKILIIMLKNKNNYITINVEEKIDLSNLNESINNNYTIIYHLYSVIYEINDNNNKKYIAKCKNKANNLWYSFNDEIITSNNDLKSEVDNYEIPLILFYYRDL